MNSGDSSKVTYTFTEQISISNPVLTLVGGRMKTCYQGGRQGQGGSHVVLHKSDDITRVTFPEALTHFLSQVVSTCKSSKHCNSDAESSPLIFFET